MTRIRGEIFLTESDLELFEQESAVVALVVVGDKCGFFVREADGSIQAIQSHEEFLVGGSEPPPSLTKLLLTPTRWGFRSVLAAATVLDLITLIAILALRLHGPVPSLGLALREEGGQLHIAWRASPTRHITLEVLDGGDRMTIPLIPGSASTTYARRTGEIEVRLTAKRGFDRTQRETTRLTHGLPPPASEGDKIRAKIAFFDAESRVLHAKIGDFHAQIVQSQKNVNSVLTRLRQQYPTQERSPAE